MSSFQGMSSPGWSFHGFTDELVGAVPRPGSTELGDLLLRKFTALSFREQFVPIHQSLRQNVTRKEKPFSSYGGTSACVTRFLVTITRPPLLERENERKE